MRSWQNVPVPTRNTEIIPGLPSEGLYFTGATHGWPPCLNSMMEPVTKLVIH